MTITIGVSLKMYFGHAQTLRWCSAVADVAASQESIRDGAVELFVVPSYPAITGSVTALAGSGVAVGAQDIAAADSGAYTGEVGGPELREIGCRLAEVGHAERRSMFAETEDVVAQKTAAALRNGLTPVLCVGEVERSTSAEAVDKVVGQLGSALDGSGPGRVIVAYEPVWAIGAAEPASIDRIRAVVSALRAAIEPRADDSAVIYGGSAKPGLLTELGHDVDGLFLGRFAHDPSALNRIISEAAALQGARA